MEQLGVTLPFLVISFILFLSVIAIIRGYKDMKISKRFDDASKKVKVGYWLIAGVHMWIGILMTLCYVIAGVLILTILLRK